MGLTKKRFINIERNMKLKIKFLNQSILSPQQNFKLYFAHFKVLNHQAYFKIQMIKENLIFQPSFIYGTRCHFKLKIKTNPKLTTNLYR